MPARERRATRLDVLGLGAAGLINTFLALLVAGVIIAPGTPSGQPDIVQRAAWISENLLVWKSAWLFWFSVTLSFSWSYFALGRNLTEVLPWTALAIGLAVIAAAVDIVGVLVNMVVLPELSLEGGATVLVVFAALEQLSNALTNIAAFGLYSLAGLLLLPAVFSTLDYPRGLAWLGVAEWSIAALATILLIAAPSLATGPLLVSFLLFAPWVWGSAIWIWRRNPAAE